MLGEINSPTDMIMIGEIRTQETMEYAMQFAETGHLCIATLHANNANQALERILHLVPKERREQFLFDLSFDEDDLALSKEELSINC